MFKNITDFIKSLYPSDFIPLHEPVFQGNERRYVVDTIDSTFVSSVGEYVTRFEKDMAAFTGHKYAVATVNGTAALHVALLMANVTDQDEVITQPLTFVATCNAISYTGAKSIFIDVDRDTMSLSPTKLSEWLSTNTEMRDGFCVNKSSGKKIKACVPMHTFGLPGRTEELAKICREKNMVLVEDIAEALGSYIGDQHAGKHGTLGILSFNGNKIITTGGGGMILTDDESIAKKAKHITTTGKIPHAWKFEHDIIAYNYRLPNINSALGVAQLESLPYFVDRKRLLAQLYDQFFTNVGMNFIKERSGTHSNYWLNSVLLKDRNQSEEFLTFTNANGVMTRPIWNTMDTLEMYKNCQHGNLENSRWLADRIVNIPSSVNFKI